ncbi:uncharacterized protein A4U43_UnF4550 [Asparagus officinalis]|uniref:Dehydrin n=1 Tax=Asparagus officinalis TaxID=4686 RepID=A0A1R3L6U1_ASPOF|nr:dehydrin COR410-like [Asparagus officinalis]ONK55341.1 uncharacterized protein A4U43_UnF4550 [Asparagus officinalis]
MAEENKETMRSEGEQVEVSDRGLFDFMGKKKEEEEKAQEEVLVTGVEGLKVEEAKKEEEKKERIVDKLHRSNSSSSSSSSDEEEVGPDGEKRKKKKGLKEKLEEKLGGKKKETEEEKIVTEQDVDVAPGAAGPPAENVRREQTRASSVEKIETGPEQERRRFPRQINGRSCQVITKRAEQPGKEWSAVDTEVGEGQDGKEKKGFLGKIMGKLPGYHKEEGEKTATPPGQ